MLDGYFLTKRWNGQYIVFDSVCYRCQWDDASTKWFYALDLMGDHATAGRLLDTVFARQGQRKPAGTRTREGCFSDVTNIARDGSAASWTSCNGWALWAMAEHARLANDRAWLAAHKKAILDGCAVDPPRAAISPRRRPNNPCRGLIYGKFVCDMPDQASVSGVGYFTYTDAISYMGLHEMAQLLADWGHPEGRTPAGRGRALPAGHRGRRRPADRQVARSLVRALGAARAQARGPLSQRRVRSDQPRLRRRACAATIRGSRHVIRWNIDHTYKGSPEASATASMFYSQDLAMRALGAGARRGFPADVLHDPRLERLARDAHDLRVAEQYAAARPFHRQPGPHVPHDAGPGTGRRAVPASRDAAPLARARPGDPTSRSAHLVRAALAALRFPRRRRQRAPATASPRAARLGPDPSQAAAAARLAHPPSQSTAGRKAGPTENGSCSPA